MNDIIKVADDADVIVNGYAFSKMNGNIRVLNLNNPSKASVLKIDGDVIETNMDDIELSIQSGWLLFIFHLFLCC